MREKTNFNREWGRFWKAVFGRCLFEALSDTVGIPDVYYVGRWVVETDVDAIDFLRRWGMPISPERQGAVAELLHCSGYDERCVEALGISSSERKDQVAELEVFEGREEGLTEVLVTVTVGKPGR